MRLSPSNRRAFSLVEVALALGVAGFCLIAVFGLLPVGMNSNRASIEQTSANGILSSVIADLRATPGSEATSSQFSIPIPAPTLAATTTIYFTNDGQFATAPDAQSRFKVTVTFIPNTSAQSATMANLEASWPAEAAKPIGSVETFLALDRN